MSENKRYYWLRLKEDFFDDETIAFLEEQENGKDYCLFYLKLCLKSLRTNGKLMRLVGDTLIPYDPKSLARLTNTDIDTVRVALELFQKIGLIQVSETREIFMTQIEELVGSETNKAEMMRAKRAREKLERGNNVTQMLPERYLEYRDIEIRDKSIDIIPLEESKDSDKSSSLSSSCPQGTPTSKKFKKPTVDEIQAYCTERGNSVDAEKFYDFYESKGWMVGKTHMKDWKAAVRTWERGNSSTSKSRADSTADKSRMEWIYDMCENPNTELPF